MVTVYELVCKLAKDPNIGDLIKCNLINQKIIDFKLIYEFYCLEKARGIRHAEAITFTGEEFNLSDPMIWKIKYKMESEV